MPADTDALIAALESPNLRELAARGRVQSYRKDVVFIQEGDYGDTLHIILSGRVKVFATGENDREVVIDTHGPGEFIGEMSLDGGPRSASVMTLEPMVCSVVTRVTLRDHIAQHPGRNGKQCDARRHMVLRKQSRGMALGVTATNHHHHPHCSDEA